VNVNIILSGTNLGTASDTSGNFRIDNLKPGRFTRKIMCMGYETEIINDILVEADQTYHKLTHKRHGLNTLMT